MFSSSERRHLGGTDGARIHFVYSSFSLMGKLVYLPVGLVAKESYRIVSFDRDDGTLLGTTKLPGFPLLIGGKGRNLVVGGRGERSTSLRLHQVRLRGR